MYVCPLPLRSSLISKQPRNVISPGALSSSGRDLDQNPFDATFAEIEDMVNVEDDVVLFHPTNPEVNNFAVLNSSLPEQHHLSSYVSAKRSASETGGKKRHRLGDPHRPKWHFGVRSRSPPMEIVLEIYKTLKVLGMEWVEKKTLGEMGGVKTKIVRDDSGKSKIERVKKLDGGGDVDLRLASSIYLVETRTRVQDVVVRIFLLWPGFDYSQLFFRS